MGIGHAGTEFHLDSDHALVGALKDEIDLVVAIPGTQVVWARLRGLTEDPQLQGDE
ncbi:hypothetical protein GCM10022223_26560 [Kineosporia mesophila]|uniref:Uncharacterized protein n=1 Tax=Kineosporia mesophila TaxID=566012 RepID=A0ABP6ZIV4_9ACTN